MSSIPYHAGYQPGPNAPPQSINQHYGVTDTASKPALEDSNKQTFPQEQKFPSGVVPNEPSPPQMYQPTGMSDPDAAPPEYQHRPGAFQQHATQPYDAANPYTNANLPQSYGAAGDGAPPTEKYSESPAFPARPSQAPPQKRDLNYGDDDPSSPVHYTRDPHKLIAYLVPFPKPHINGVEPAAIPDRFLIYTPPPPPLAKPVEGEKEANVHKVQRKWQEEVRAAKTSNAKTASWKGVKSKATRGISKAISLTTTSSLDFLTRVPDGKASANDTHSEDGAHEGETTHQTVGLEEMVLIYPTSFGSSQEQVKTEFVNSMLRSKTKAQRDAVIASGLLPVSLAIDILATVIWPFGGLLEIDSVWAYASIRGAKTARSVTKRLNSSTKSGDKQPEYEDQSMQGDTLNLVMIPSARLEVLHRYLSSKCSDRDVKLFPNHGVAPTENDVLSAVGWSPSHNASEKNWEDEEWETTEVKDDLKAVMTKGSKEWDKWCKAFAKDPQKALKK
ncbi:hypothetical protein MMC12_000298 [Toensbergia leucococca]|nr:hypothetical protein [Toensbergia leucococca]